MAGASRGLRCLTHGARSFCRQTPPQCSLPQPHNRPTFVLVSLSPSSTRPISTSIRLRRRQDDEIAEAEARAHAEQLLAKLGDDETRSFALSADANETGFADAEAIYEELPVRPEVKEDKEPMGFFAMDEENDDPDGDGDFDTDDISSNAHLELEQVREMRQFSRLTSWDMPLLWQYRKEFQPPTSATPLKFRYTSYLGDTHPGARKVVMSFHIPSLPDMTPAQQIKFIKLLGARYNPSTQEAKMSEDRYPTAAQNKRSLGDLLARLVREAKEGEDSFEDVPLDFRHHTPKRRFAFPEQWKMSDARRRQLDEARAESSRAERQRELAGAGVDGVRLIAEGTTATAAAQGALREAVNVPAGGQRVRMLRR